MQETFNQHIHTKFPQLFEKEHLVAISGGLDSVVLVHLLKAKNIKFQLAHCNFKLREAESDGDEQFVRQLAKDLNLKIHVKQCETKTFAAENGISTQMAARDLRYSWFEELLQKHSLAAVLTAHHLDDQLETFLINLNRGAGISGLVGIPEQTDTVLRPLLSFTRVQIFEYAQHQKITWREDSSNQSNDYQRNKLRNLVLPILHETLPQLQGNFGQTLDYLKDVKSIVADGVVRFRESVTTTNATAIDLYIDEVKAFPNFKNYLFYLLEEYGFYHIHEVISLMDATTGKYLSNENFILLKDRDVLRLEKITEPITKKWYLLPETTALEVENTHLVLETITTDKPMEFLQEHRTKKVLLLDKEHLEYPLILRVWEDGERLEPYGMVGSQLVSDILTNKKRSRIEKQKQLVLRSGNQLLWVLGLRSSRHFVVTPQTKQILKITWNT